MIDKEFTEDIYDIEQEPLDLNISTFGKHFPAKSLEKVLGDSLYDNYFSENRIWKDEILLDYIKARIEKIKQQKSLDKEDNIILKLFEVFELMYEAEKNTDEDFTMQYLDLYDEKEILLKLMMMIEKKFKDSLDTALDLIIGQSFSDINEE